MTFEEILKSTLEMLQRQGKVSYRALKRQFSLDDAYLEDLKFEIIHVHGAAIDQDEVMLVRIGAAAGFAGRLASPPGASPILSATAPAATNAALPSQQDAVLAAAAHTIIAQGERRHLTVMFCDLVGSTALSESLDPEDLREVLNVYHEFTQKAIASYDGYLAKYMGDGLLIYFGYPQAHEDDAVRAVRSGLRILEAVAQASAQFAARWGVSLGVRIGVHTGLVVAGEIGAGEMREALAVVGETPNIAARLQGLAEANMLVISVETLRLITGYFECVSLGAHHLKGISEPMPVYYVLHENAARSRFDVAVEATLTPLAGRDAEMQFLMNAWAQAREGQSQAVLITGEAGIGKSRLIWELKRHVSGQADAWLTECQASPYHANSAFYPVIELLERVVLQFTRQDSAEDKLVKLEGFLIQYGLSLTENMPLFASLLSLSYEDRYAPLALSPELQRQRITAALVTILLRRAIQQPMLFVVEDLHWIDSSTLELLSQLLNLAPDAHLLILLTCRPEFTPSWDVHRHDILVLQNLSQAQAKMMITRVSGDKPLPSEIVQQIVQKADGIPLYVEEITKSVLESGLLVEHDARYELAGPLPAVAIPTSLHDSLVARLDRLSVVKEIAQLGATLAREFTYELVAAVSPWSEEVLQAGLMQLVAAELLYQHGVLPEATYRFKHALIRDAAYESLLKSRRLQYHLRIAQVLEERFTEEVSAHPEQLAHHYSAGGAASHAIPYWIRAGQQALSRAANHDAMAHYRRGLETLSELPEGADRYDQELNLQLGLAPALMAIQGWASIEVGQLCQRSRELSLILNDFSRLTAALWGLWTFYFLRGELDNALITAQETLQLAVTSEDPILFVAAHHAVGYTHFYRGEPALAAEVARKGLSRFDLAREHVLVVAFQLSCSTVLNTYIAHSLWMMGYSDQADEQVSRARALAIELNHKPTYAYSLGTSCYHYQPVGNLEWVEENSAELIALSLAEGFQLWLAIGILYHGWARGMRGELEDGIEEAKKGLALFLESGTRTNVPCNMTMLAELLWRARRFEEALEAVETGLSEVARRNEHHMEPELYRLRGEILIDQAGEEKSDSVLQQAEAYFDRSLEIARSQGARILELRTLVSKCRHAYNPDSRAETRVMLSQQYQSFTEGWEASDLKEARAMLQILDAMEAGE